jgi:hypothetical protein
VSAKASLRQPMRSSWTVQWTTLSSTSRILRATCFGSVTWSSAGQSLLEPWSRRPLFATRRSARAMRIGRPRPRAGNATAASPRVREGGGASVARDRVRLPATRWPSPRRRRPARSSRSWRASPSPPR